MQQGLWNFWGRGVNQVCMEGLRRRSRAGGFKCGWKECCGAFDKSVKQLMGVRYNFGMLSCKFSKLLAYCLIMVTC